MKTKFNEAKLSRRPSGQKTKARGLDTLEGVLGPSFFHSESAIRGTRPQKSRHALGNFGCPTTAAHKAARMGDEGKAVGFPGRRLCYVNSAFLCSRSHRAKLIRDPMRVSGGDGPPYGQRRKLPSFYLVR